MKRPLLTALLFLIFGILVGQYAADAFVLFFVLICVLNAFIFFLFRRLEYILLFLILFSVGFFSVGANLYEPAELAGYASDGNVLIMDGVVLDVNETARGRLKLIVRLLCVDDGERSTDCDVKIQAITEKTEDIWISRGIRLRGKLECLDERRNLGGFNEALYLKSRKIMYKTFPEVLEKGETVMCLENYLSDVKNKLAQVYEEVLPPREAGVVKAMIVGDRAGLEADISELYRNVGIFHVLAISGLHVSALGMLLDLLLGRIFGKKISGIVTICFLILYSVMTGGSVSAVRAAIMMTVVIFARLLNRSSDLPVSTAFAAICLLLYQPLYLWDIGFQYSFGAVFGIAFFTEPVEYAMKSLSEKNRLALVLNRKYVMKYFPATLAATMATTPVMLYHFYYFPVYAVIVNMIIVPSVSVELMSGVASGLLGFINIEAASFTSGAAFFTLRAYEGICSFFNGLPASTILTGKPRLWMCAYWYASLFCMVYLHRRILKKWQFDKKYFLAFLIIPVAAVYIYGLRKDGLVVDMLDVGQGECIVITEGGVTFLVDGGGKNRSDAVNDTGRRIIKPYLDYRGIEKVDAAFISHFDADHAAGVLEIMELKQVGKVFIPNINLISKVDEETRNNYDRLISIADEYKIQIEELSAGESIIAGNMIIECLNPHTDKVYSDSNAASLVLRLSYGQTGLLLTGDIDSGTERFIIERAGDVRTDVLALAHHGSKYSNHESFIEAVAPRAAIVSTGRSNGYGHPSKIVREILDTRGIPLFNTAECGMIRIVSDGSEMRIEKMIDQKDK